MTKAIANAQRKVSNFDIRKQLLEYDDVANDQRRAIYTQRNELLDVSVGDAINGIREEDVFKGDYRRLHSATVAGRDYCGISRFAGTPENDTDTAEMPIAEWLDKSRSCMRRRCVSASRRSPSRCISVKKRLVGAEMMRHFTKKAYAANARFPVEELWRRWITCVRGIHLRGQ